MLSNLFAHESRHSNLARTQQATMETAPIDLLPTALFSPSKAAEQRALAKEWQQVDAWLSAKYQGRSVPQFERNEDTLKALVALSASNEKADEERDLLWAVQKEALAEMKQAAEQNGSIISALQDGLDAHGREALEALADVATRLDSKDTGTLALADGICDKTQISQMLAQQLLQLTQLHNNLEHNLSSLRGQLQELRAPAFQAPLSLQRQTLEWTRNTKQLRTKIAEYTDRLAVIQASQTDTTAADVHNLVEREEELTALEDKLGLLSAQVKAYQGLPKDKDAAIDEIRTVETQVVELQRKLDSIFEGLVEAV